MARPVKLALIFILLMLLSFPSEAGAIARGWIDSSVELGGFNDQRVFSTDISVYIDSKTLGQLPSSSTVLLLDSSERAGLPVETPQEEFYYKANHFYEDLDEDIDIFTQDNGIFYAVYLQDDSWYISRNGEEQLVGERINGADCFARDVFYNAKTLMDCQKEAAEAYIDFMAQYNPKSQIAIIYDEEQELKLYGLDSENLSSLKETVKTAALSDVTDGGLFEQAGYLLDDAAHSEKNIIYISAFFNADSELEQAAAVEEAYLLKQKDVELFILDIQKEEETLLKDMSSKPVSKHYKNLGYEDLAAKMKEIALSGLGAGEAKSVLLLDPRFGLTNGQKEKFREQDISFEEREDCSTWVEWPLNLLVTEGDAGKMSIELTAKNDFIGGNDVPLMLEKSGIYQDGIMTHGFETIKLNVPVNSQLKDQTTEIFMGQSIPVVLDGESIEKRLTGANAYNWYDNAETGELELKWTQDGAGEISGAQDIAKQMPGEDRTFKYTIGFSPNSDGKNSIGEPVKACELTAAYKVKVVSGKITVKLSLDKYAKDWDNGSVCVLKLSGRDTVQYKALSIADRDEDGENLTLEGSFENLPYGSYIITNEYNVMSGTSGSSQSGLQCIIGIEEGGDSIDLKNSLKTLQLQYRPEQAENEQSSSKVGIDRVQIQLAKG